MGRVKARSREGKAGRELRKKPEPDFGAADNAQRETRRVKWATTGDAGREGEGDRRE